MKQQSASRDASSRFLGKAANTYCCAHWKRLSLVEKTVIARLGTGSSRPLGWPTYCSAHWIRADLSKTSNRCPRDTSTGRLGTARSMSRAIGPRPFW